MSGWSTRALGEARAEIDRLKAKNLIGLANIRALWNALTEIRGFVEDHAAPGSVTDAEYLLNPEPMTEAQAIIKGIAALLPTPERQTGHVQGEAVTSCDQGVDNGDQHNHDGRSLNAGEN